MESSAAAANDSLGRAEQAAAGRRRLRIVYVAGPGDVIGTWEHWRVGEDDPRSTDVAWSAQFYDLCQKIGADALLIAQRTDCRKFSAENIRVLYQAAPWQNSANAGLYHLGQLWNGLRLTCHAVRFKADVMVVSMGTHWFMLSLPAWFGIRVVPDLCCTLWPAGRRKRNTVSAIVRWLDARFWRKRAAATLCVSEECERQVLELTGVPNGPLILYRPWYRKRWMSELKPPDHQKRPFVLLFVGRVEENKGVFDLLEVMRRLESARPGVFRCILCGDGSALQAVRREVARLGLCDSIELTGHLERSQLLGKLAVAHMAVAPTTAAFAEGLNRAIVEGILAGRPVLATNVCPVRDALAPAVIEVNCGDVSAMTEAVLRLEIDAEFYWEKQSACSARASQFYDAERSWGAALRKAIDAASPKPVAALQCRQ
jgi:glycosyltransferase involved in cell wall biosynthesis